MNGNKYQQMMERDARRLNALRAIEIAYTGPLGFLNPNAEAMKRARFFGSCTLAQNVEFALYHSYQRKYLN